MPNSASGFYQAEQNMTNSSSSVRVMLVDDSVMIRGLIKRMLEPESDIEIVASVGNGKLAVERLKEGGVDVIVLDIEMPVMDGLTALPLLLGVDPNIKIIMASTLTLANAEISIEAMKMGAADYVPKPTSTTKIAGPSDFRSDIIAKIRALGGARLRTPERPARVTNVADTRRVVSTKVPGDFQLRPSSAKMPPEIVAIGSSTGGPKALFVVLKNITSVVKVPIVIAQHMPPSFTTILAKHIETSVGRPCAEAVDGEILENGRIYLAPGDYHMIVEAQGFKKVLRLNQEAPENYCRPAVDPLFRSVANVYGDRVLSVVLTGMGSDGSRGAKVIADAGGTVIAQDETTSVVWGMPGATAALGVCSAVLPLEDVASYINNFVAKGRA